MNKTIIAASLAIATMAHADPPVVGQMDGRYKSGYFPGTMTANGKVTKVVLHNFGSDDIERARNFGAHLAPIPYEQAKFDQMAVNRAEELYPGDNYFIRAFDIQAKGAYMTAMKMYARESVQ